jgi:hypothetical protein
MPSFKTVFGSFLKTEDLQGKSVRVMVESVTLETIKGHEGAADERKLVAKFAGKDKGLVLNKTRCEQMEAVFSTDDYDQWVGPVTLSPGTTKFGGKTVGCVDIGPVSAGKPKPAPVEVEDVDDSAIPF